MKKFRSLIFTLALVFTLVFVTSCTIIDDTHIHRFEDGSCACGDLEENYPELAKYEVVILDEDGEVQYTLSILEGTLLPKLADLHADGKKFIGWYYGEQQWDFNKSVVRENMTIEPRFIDNAPYNIKYELNGGEFEGEVVDTYISGIGLATLPTPVREHHVFLGWYENGTLVDGISDIKVGTVTLSARWEQITHKVEYDLQGGAFEQGVIIPSEYAEGVGLPSLIAPSRQYYTFAGWTLEGEVVEGLSEELDQDVKLVATWKANVYEINYDLDGGSFVGAPAEEYTTEQAVTFVKAEREGYTFLGWYVGEQKVEGIALGSGGVVNVVAHWQINQYKVTFVLGNGEENVVLTQDYATAIVAPVPEKEGYTFKGWDKEVAAKVPAEDLTYTAQYTINQYTYKFVDHDGEVLKELKVDYNTEIVAPADPEREGYTFSAWSPAVDAKLPAKDVTYTAQYTINQYKVTFVLGNGEEDVVSVLDYGTAIVAPADPAKEGYTFKAWSPAVDAKLPAKDVTYTAQYTINQYKVTFVLGNGEEDVVLTQDYATAIVAPVPTRTGYTFGGWDKEVAAKVPAEDLTYTAKWNVVKYSISYDAEGYIFVSSHDDIVAEFLKDFSAFSGTEITGAEQYWANGSKTNFWKNAEMHAKWSWIFKFLAPLAKAQGQSTQYLDNMNADPVSVSGYATQNVAIFLLKANATIWNEQYKALANDTGLSSKWTTVDCTGVVFDSYKSYLPSQFVVSAKEYTIESAQVEFPVLSKVGYTFLGWFVGEDKVSNIPAKSHGDVALTAKWQINEYTITYTDSEGYYQGEASQKYTVLSDDILLPAPTKDGYTFLGWFDSEDQKHEKVSKGSTGNLDLFAKWELESYSIEYDLDGGIIEPFLDYNRKITLSIYDNVGGASGSYFADTSITPKNSLRWQYKVLLQYDSETDSYEVVALDAAKASTNNAASAAGVTWTHVIANSTNNITTQYTVGEAIVFEKTPAVGDENIDAYVYDNAALISKNPSMVDNYNVNDQVAFPTPIKEGHTFLGWHDGENYVASISKGSKGALSLTAKWDANEYKLTFKLDNGQEDVVLIQDYGTSVVAPTPTKVGHSYVWNKSVPATMPAYNATYTAVWTPNTYKLHVTVDGVVTEVEYKYGDTVAPIDASKEGYQFDGWVDGEENAAEFPVTMPAGNVTLVAKHSIKQYTLTFNPDNGNDAVVITKDFGSSYEAPANPVKDGYTFNGWDLSVEGVYDELADELPETIVAQDRTYKAIWVENAKVISSITYYETSAKDKEASFEVSAPATYVETVGIAELPTPTRAHYTFNGWTLNGTPVTSISTTQTGNIELVATWTAVSYGITYSGIENATHANPATYTIESEIELAPATKAGYDFLGWFNNEDQKVTEINGLSGELALTAKWEIVEYTITFDGNGGLTPSQYATVDEAIADFLADYNTARGTSHTVDTFFALGSGSEIGAASLFLYNTTYRAKWAWLVDYIATVASSANKPAYEAFNNYNSQAELNAVNGNYIYEIAYELRAWVAQSQYTKNQWYHTADYSQSEVSEKMWNHVVKPTYTVESAEIKLPKSIRSYYNFLGWYVGDEKVETIAAGSTGNKSYVAKWAPVTYTISYEGLDGATYPELVTLYNIESETIVLPIASQMSLSGAEFNGWYTDGAYTSSITQIETGSHGNITIYAYWLFDTATEYELSDDDALVLSQISATKVVIPGLESGKYNLMHGGTSYGEFTIGVDAFKTLGAATNAAVENDVIYVSTGTYTDAVTISAANVQIIGPNYGVKGQANSRKSEAVVDIQTNISADTVQLNGLKHTKPINVAGNDVLLTNLYVAPTTTIQCYTGDNRKGCIVDGKAIKGLIVSDSLIDAPGTSNSYLYQFMTFGNVTNLTITGNYITNTTQSTISSSFAGMMIYNCSGTMNITNNEFDWGTDGYLLRIGEYSNSCSAINIVDNVMDGATAITKTAGLRIQKSSTTCVVTIMGNTINNCSGSTIMFNNDKGSTVNVMYNNFGSGTAFKVGTLASAKLTFVSNYYAVEYSAATSVVPTDYGTVATVDALNSAYAAYKESLE